MEKRQSTEEILVTTGIIIKQSMAFVITYRRFFAVEILHSYFLDQGKKAYDALDLDEKARVDNNYSVKNFFKIRPSYDTKRMMAKRGMIFRETPSGFVVGLRIEQETKNTNQEKPAISLDDPFKLRFSIELSDPYLFNYTSLPFNIPRNQLLYFHNRVNNSEQGQIHLTKPLESYVESKMYEPGDLIVDSNTPAEKVFEAIQSTTGPFEALHWKEILVGETYNNVPGSYEEGEVARLNNSLFRALQTPTVDPPDANQWEEMPIFLQYASHLDTIRVLPSSFTIDFTELNPLPDSAQAFLYKEGTNDLIFSSDLVNGGPIPSFSVDMSTVDPGAYDFKVKKENGDEIDTAYSGRCYLDQQLVENKTWALIEIENHHLPAQEDYWLLTDDEQLKQPTFSLRFKNRSTFWRYIFNRPQNVADNELGEFERDGDATDIRRKRKFKTKEPKPLTKGLEKLKKFDTNILLPNPQVTWVKPDKADKKVYSEIYINT